MRRRREAKRPRVYWFVFDEASEVIREEKEPGGVFAADTGHKAVTYRRDVKTFCCGFSSSRRNGKAHR